MNWFVIASVTFVAFSWLTMLTLCRATRLGSEMAAKLVDERRAA